MEQTGTYVIYAAGTGILAFSDLISHLILSLIAKYEGHSALKDVVTPIDIDNFKLILYTSFQDEKEAVCLSLIEGLIQLCKKYKRTDLFEHDSRLSRVAHNSGKWD